MTRRSPVLVLGTLVSSGLALAQTPVPPPPGTPPTTTPANPPTTGPDGATVTPDPTTTTTEPTTTEPTTAPDDHDNTDPTLAQDLGISASVFTARLYGYIDGHYEKSAKTPASVSPSGQTEYANNPGEWDLTNFHIMVQGNVFGTYRYFLNLRASGADAGDDAGLGVRNAWIEFPMYRDLFNFRIGKIYRRFGLYNEVLDAVPTFIGIEPPEMFDGDHLMLTRTTNAMLHGKLTSNDATISYALSTGNDERSSAEIPFAADLRFNFQPGILLGGSFYTSNGDAVPAHDVDGGNPVGGVANWMSKDDFKVYSVFGQLDTAGFTLQLEYTAAVHDAERDPMKLETLAAEANLFRPQLQRFFSDPDDPTAATARTAADYTIRAAYFRAGYQLKVGKWQLVPYAQLDYYVNKEMIDSEDYGGDHEAGLADDGVFYKSTLGLVLRPARFVAIKVDGSTHTQKFNGSYETYPEIRTSFSLYWELGDAQ